MGAAASLSAETIGQIALIQSIVFNLPDSNAMFRFICRGLEAVPGTGRIDYHIMEDDGDQGAPIENSSAAMRRFPLHLKGRTFGELLIEVVDSTRFDPYLPYIENLTFMLAVIFEERRQRRLNKAYEAELEERVHERTRQLEQAIKDYSEAQTALKISEERQRLAMEATQDGLWDLNLKSGNLFWSPRCYAMLGYAPAQFPMNLEKWLDRVHPEDRASAWPTFLHHLQNHGKPSEIEFRCAAKDGSWRLIVSRAKPVEWDTEGYVVRVVGTSVDITERRRIEHQLQKSQKMEAIGTLAGGIAHDFNNILGIIIGNAELAIGDLPEYYPAHKYLQEIKRAGLRAKDVVRQLLSFGRKTEQRKIPINLRTIVDESLQLLRASIPSMIAIRTQAPSDLKSIAADPTQIHQVLINLCTNAAHAMEAHGGVMEINLSNFELADDACDRFYPLAPGSYVRLSISDTGCGIVPHILERVFDPYFTTKKNGKGTGIGLSVVHGIVKSHDGAIFIDSEPNVGTTVTVLFPMVDAQPVQPAPIVHDLPTGTERILFVDDETALAKMGKLILERLGYEVIAQTDPVAAMALFKATPDRFDLVITDMSMPRMTGDQLIARMLSIRPELPTILCTGFSEKITARGALSMGVRKFIDKPFNQHDLATAIRNALDER